MYSLILSQIFGQAEIPKLEKTITIGRLKIMLISDEERDFNLQTIRNDNPDRVIIVNLSLGGRNDVIYTYNSFGVKDLDLIGVTAKMVSSLGKENVIFVTSAGNVTVTPSHQALVTETRSNEKLNSTPLAGLGP